MRSVLRRLLWLGPALLLITMVTFGALSMALRHDPASAGADADLPLFFNPEPGSVERVALRALRAVAASERAPEAEAELVQLGGAALPFVLPELDTLSPEGRGRVVRALRPVGVRMGFEIDPRWDPSREVLFWTRFWEEHAIDYRPQVARRAVLRLVQKSTLLRDTEVRQLDTYALGEIMRQMASVDDAVDVDRVQRLSDIALDMLGQPPSSRGAWRMPPEADLDDARAVAATWTDWWSRNRTRYRTYSGTDRITAMLRDTRYGGWVTRAVRHDLGLLGDGRSVGEALRQGASVSGLLLSSGVLGSFGAAALGGMLSVLARGRSRRELRVLAVLRAALPVAVVAALASRLGARGELGLGAAIMALFGAPLASLHPSARLEARASDFARTLESFGVARWRVALSTLRLSSAVLVLPLGAQLATLITLTFVVEHALGLSGLGARTIDALKHPDLNWLMAITIITALFVGVLQSASEVLLSLLDPRWKDGVDRLGGVA